MKNNIASLLRGIKLITIIAVLFGTNILGFSIAFIGFAPDISEFKQATIVLGLYAFSSLLIGILMTKAWYISFLTTLTIIFLGLSIVQNLLLYQRHENMREIIIMLVLIPLLSLIFGYLGHLNRKMFFKLFKVIGN